MKTTHILLIYILGAALVFTVVCHSGATPKDCCYNFHPKRMGKKRIFSYYVTDVRCPKTGVILVTQKSRHICVDSKLSWVQNIRKYLDEKSF